MSTQVETSAEDATSEASHLEAAREFFPSPGFTKKEPVEKAAVKTETKSETKAETVDKKPAIPSIFSKKTEQKVETAEKAPDNIDYDSLKGPDEKSPTRPDWEKMKTAAKSDRARLAELEKQLKERAPIAHDEATKARLAQLEQANKEYSERLKLHDLANHPEFVAQYVTPVNKAVDGIKQTLKVEGIDADVDKLMKLDGKQFSKAVSDLLGDASEFTKTVLFEQFRQAKVADMARAEAVANADSTRSKIQQNFSARSKQVFDEVGKEMSLGLSPAEIGEKATDEEKQLASTYNSGLGAIGKRAEELAFTPPNDRSVAQMAHNAAAFEFLVTQGLPRFERMVATEISSRDAKIASLEKEISDLAGSRPRVGPTGGESNTVPDETEQSHLESARKYFPR